MKSKYLQPACTAPVKQLVVVKIRHRVLVLGSGFKLPRLIVALAAFRVEKDKENKQRSCYFPVKAFRDEGCSVLFSIEIK